MTVKETIKVLQDCNPDAEVKFGTVVLPGFEITNIVNMGSTVEFE